MTPRKGFNLGLPKRPKEKGPSLTIRPTKWQRQRLDEIASKLEEREGGSVSVSLLIRAAINRHIDYGGKISRTEQREIVGAATSKPKREFDLKESRKKVNALQILFPLERIEALDEIARQQGKDRSKAVRDAIDYFIAYVEKNGIDALLETEPTAE